MLAYVRKTLVAVVIVMTAMPALAAPRSYETNEEVVRLMLDLLRDGSAEELIEFLKGAANSDSERRNMNIAGGQIIAIRDAMNGFHYFRKIQESRIGNTLYFNYWYVEGQDQGLFLEIVTSRRADLRYYFQRFNLQSKLDKIVPPFGMLRPE